MKISVIIPVYNREKHFRACLRSIKYQTYSNLEVIVVDDATDEYSVLKVALEILDCKIVRLEPPKNFRLTQALNAGISISIGDIIQILSSDVIVPPDYFDQIIKFHKKYSNLLISPRLYMIPNCRFFNNNAFNHCSTLDNIKEYYTGGGSGLISFEREWFYKVNGYNNTFLGHGDEENEFIGLCIETGMRFIVINSFMYHIKHENIYETPLSIRISRCSGNMYNTYSPLIDRKD